MIRLATAPLTMGPLGLFLEEHMNRIARDSCHQHERSQAQQANSLFGSLRFMWDARICSVVLY